MSQDPTLHGDAKRRFLDLQDSLSIDPAATAVLEALWKEVLVARRSAMYWEHISHAEKGISDRIAKTHVQLQQNYLRLMQEQ
ncbi:MAG: hypothetical protein HC866_05120 [Leptolyngbyaceae cyanobacterium RU_5_1]|nr:hypothetical protein [Leptolyngbyaceae cyanobacterium RU_5_1]